MSTKVSSKRQHEPGYGTEEWVERLLLLKDHSKKDLKGHLPGTFGMHEALHLSSVLCSVVDEQLRCHPAILQDHQAFVLATHAFEALYDLYQRLGDIHLREDSTTVAPPARRPQG